MHILMDVEMFILKGYMQRTHAILRLAIVHPDGCQAAVVPNECFFSNKTVSGEYSAEQRT